MRKSFIIHKDSLAILDELNDEQVGKLFRAIAAYQNGKEIEVDTLTKIAMVPFKNQFERDEQAYNHTIERNKLNGIKGGRPKNPNNPSGSFDNPNNPLGFSETHSNPLKPKKPDSDSDSDSKNDSKSKNNKINNSSAKAEVDTTSFLNSYNKFLKHRTGVEEQFSIAGRTALKKIRAYFRPMVEKKHPTATPEIIEAETLKSFEWVLANFEKWDSFHQKQLKLEQINSNLINIISSIKNGNTKQNNGHGSKQRFDAAGVAAEAHAILKTKFGQPRETTEHTPEGGLTDHDSEGGFTDYEVLQ